MLMLCRTVRSESLGFPSLGFALHVPAAKIEGDSRAGGAQFIGKIAISHGPRHDHASDGQGRYALRCGATTAASLDQAPLQDAYHCFEHRFECAFCARAAPRTR